MRRIIWDKVPDRLQSDALKCIICRTATVDTPKHGREHALAHCCTHLMMALLLEDDEPFEDLDKLDAAIHRPDSAGLTPEEHKHVRYWMGWIIDRVHEMLKSAVKCPGRDE